MAQYHPPRTLTRVTAPTLEPITLAEAKLFLRVDGDVEDSLISALMATAREAAEQFTGKSFITQTWRVGFAGEAPETINLPMSPVQAVVSVETVDAFGLHTTIANNLYHLHTDAAKLECDATLTGSQVLITYRTGYGDSSTHVPHPIRHALLVHVAALYDDRDAQAIPANVRTLLAPYREVRV